MDMESRRDCGGSLKSFLGTGKLVEYLLMCRSSKLLLITGLLAGGAFASEAPEGIIDRYLSATRQQQTALRGVSMEVDIDASVPKLKKEGKLHALRNISKIGIVTYRMLGFNGDNSVKKEVIARYLAAEVQSQSGPNISITPENYKFKYKGKAEQNARPAYQLSVSPRKKQVGLFKGELWLDEATCMPVREAGRFVKNPSIFMKRMDFVRLYDIHDGVSIPTEVSSSVNTRLFGPVQLNIHFTHFTRETQPESLTVASVAELQE